MKHIAILALMGILVISMTFSSVYAGHHETLSPKQQMANGVIAEDVVCKEGLQLMVRSNGDAICVKESSVMKLVDMGLGIVIDTSMIEPVMHDETEMEKESMTVMKEAMEGWDRFESIQDPGLGHEEHQLAVLLPPSENTYTGTLKYDATEPIQLVSLRGPLVDGEEVAKIWTPDGETRFELTLVDNESSSGEWEFSGNALAVHTFNTNQFLVDVQINYEETSPVTAMETMIGDIDISMAATLEGSADAPITIIEFGDFQCPKCDAWFQNEKPTIVTEYIDTNKAKLYFLDFTFLGDDSISAAQASYCAEDQGMYWEYHAHLYNNQGGINEGWASIDNLKLFAVDVGLDTTTFDECLDSDKYNNRVSHNTSIGTSNSVEGTPAFFIVGSDGTIERIDGPQPSTVFATVIDGMC